MEFMESLNAIFETFNNGATATKSAHSLITQARGLVQKSDVPKDGEVEKLISSALDQIFDAKEANFAVKEKLSDLRSAIDEANRNQEKFGCYEPWETPMGAFVYKLKEADANGQSIHYICPDCRDKNTKSFLQPTSGGKQCYVCDKVFSFEKVSFVTTF